jgi:hypothetical protein
LREPGLREPGLREPGLREPGLREPGLREPPLMEPQLRESALEAPHELRHNIGRKRRSPVKFKFDLQHGYTMVKGMHSRMIKNRVNSGGTEDLKYIYALQMGPDFKLMDNLMPQVLGQFPKLLKASGEDHDTPILSSALAGLHRVILLEAMQF